MISGDPVNLLSCFCAEDGATITNISDVANLIDYKKDNSTAAASLDWVFRLGHFQELALGVFEATFQGLDWVVGEMLVLGYLDLAKNYIFVHIVFQKI